LSSTTSLKCSDFLVSQDERLIAGYAKHKPSDYKRGCYLSGFFDKVADYVGYGVSKEQCKIRWFTVNPEYKDRNRGPWTDEEVRLGQACSSLLV
jgi:hypothetical protein